MEKTNIKNNPYLFFDEKAGELLSFSELASLVKYCKPKADIGEAALIEKILAIAMTEYKIGGEKNLETNGQNNGPIVNKYLASVSLAPGYAWCCAFCAWCVYEGKGKFPKTAYVPYVETYGIDNKILSDIPNRGDCFLIYDKDGPYHIGFVLEVINNKIKTLEGNTSPDGNPNGYGIFIRERNISDCKFFQWYKIG